MLGARRVYESRSGTGAHGVLWGNTITCGDITKVVPLLTRTRPQASTCSGSIWIPPKSRLVDGNIFLTDSNVRLRIGEDLLSFRSIAFSDLLAPANLDVYRTLYDYRGCARCALRNWRNEIGGTCGKSCRRCLGFMYRAEARLGISEVVLEEFAA